MCKTKKEVIEIDPSIALSFPLKLNDLKTLMELKSVEATDKIKVSYGGVEGLAQKLNSNIVTGLSGDSQDISNRQIAFGKNYIPPKEPQPFWKLVFEALQDLTLIVLLICAVISIGLSFYNPPVTLLTEEYTTSSHTGMQINYLLKIDLKKFFVLRKS